MPIVATDIQFRLSGGSSNTVGNSSLGGEISSAVVGSGLHALFDYVSGAESYSGDTEYRCIYVYNGHSSLTWFNVKIWIATNTPAADTHCQIGVGTSGVNGVEQAVANEKTAPFGVAFFDAESGENALLLGDIPAGQHRAVWIKRTVMANASSYNNDGVTLAVIGETAV